MELRVCPECNKAFYSLHDSEVVACPHCGFILHDRRRTKRVTKEIDCCFSVEGELVRAKLQDYSKDGLRVVYSGHALGVDTVFDVEVEDLDVHRPAKAVWAKKISKSQFSVGLKLL